MWTKRRTIAARQVGWYRDSAPTLLTPAYTRQQCDSAAHAALTTEDEDFHCISSLRYTLVPRLSPMESKELLPWVMARWVAPSTMASTSPSGGQTDADTDIAALACDTEVVAALSQVEYFVFGTDNGQTAVLPLVPSHFLRAVAERHGERFPHLQRALRADWQDVTASTATDATTAKPSIPLTSTSPVPVNCGLRLLLHRHLREEPVIALDLCGALVASAASTDASVAISFFHPRPQPVLLLPHPTSIRCLRLWEGAPFADAGVSATHSKTKRSENAALTSTPGTTESHGAETTLHAHWQHLVRAAERAAVYLFTGEEQEAIVRLYRIDVQRGTYALLQVFVVAPSHTGFTNPLAGVSREDVSRAVVYRLTDSAIHCIAIDGDARLLAGVEGGVCVWSLEGLALPVPQGSGGNDTDSVVDTTKAAAAAMATNAKTSFEVLAHSFSWDVARRQPMTGALLASEGFLGTISDGEAKDVLLASLKDKESTTAAAMSAAVNCARHRAARLVNQHVWVRDADLLRAQLTADVPDRSATSAPPADLVVKKERSRWKPKYGRAVTGGAAVGVVSNEAAVPSRASGSKINSRENVDPNICDGAAAVTLAEVLAHTVVTLSFEGGQVRNDVSFPLSCVEPAAYPLAFLRMPGSACFTVQVLKPLERVVSSGSDARVCVWFWDEKQATYIPLLVGGPGLGSRRGIGRHACVMRSPDVFLSCGYDDGVVREWHVYDEPERLLRCERRFTMLPSTPETGAAGGSAVAEQFKELANVMTWRDTTKEMADSSSDTSGSSEGDAEKEDGVAGISCAAGFPPFGAVFLVAVFEPTIQAFTLTEVQGCEAPPDYIYNGFKTVKMHALSLPSVMGM